MLDEKIYHSITHGQLNKNQMFEQIAKDLKSNDEFLITVGTDSQTYSKTKIVTVICLHRIGKGGKFFYSIEHVKHMENVRLKVYNETWRSIEMAKELTEFLFSRNLDFDIVVHVDIGKSKKGKTAELINEIMGWVKSEGFKPEIKPNSYAASCIADRISK